MLEMGNDQDSFCDRCLRITWEFERLCCGRTAAIAYNAARMAKPSCLALACVMEKHLVQSFTI